MIQLSWDWIADFLWGEGGKLIVLNQACKIPNMGFSISTTVNNAAIKQSATLRSDCNDFTKLAWYLDTLMNAIDLTFDTVSFVNGGLKLG